MCERAACANRERGSPSSPDREHASRTRDPKRQAQRLELQTDSRKTGGFKTQEGQPRDVGGITASSDLVRLTVRKVASSLAAGLWPTRHNLHTYGPVFRSWLASTKPYNFLRTISVSYPFLYDHL